MNSSENEQKIGTKNSSPNFLNLPFSSPPFNFVHITPFSRQPLCTNPNFQLLTDASNAVRKSIIANVNKCLEMLQDLRSRNVVLDKIVSLTSNLQRTCQIPRRDFQNFSVFPSRNFAAILPGDSVAGVVVANGVLNFLNIYNTLLVVRLVLTWFPSAPQQIVNPLSTICDPYLNIFRGIIPPLGGLDLSPILAFLVLNAFTSTASALPAELPPQDIIATTESQKKWMAMIAANNTKTSSNDHI